MKKVMAAEPVQKTPMVLYIKFHYRGNHHEIQASKPFPTDHGRLNFENTSAKLLWEFLQQL
jgi:hypothetical protein